LRQSQGEVVIRFLQCGLLAGIFYKNSWLDDQSLVW